MTTAPEQLYARAQEAHRAGRHPDARRLLEQARVGAEDPDLVGRIELTLAYVEAETGAPEQGLDRCRAALDLPGTTPVTRGLIWSQLALLSVRSGDRAAAFEHFGQAIDLLAGEHEHLGRALLNRGDLHLRISDPAAAVPDLEGAVRHFHQAELPVQAAKAEHNLGYAMLLTGDLVGALARMESAAEVLAPESPVSRAVGEQDRAEVLLAAGRAREAAAALEAAIEAYREQGLPRFQAECEFVLAGTLLHDDPGAAHTVARRAAARFAEHDNPVWRDRAQALALVADVLDGAGSAQLVSEADRLVVDLHAAGHSPDAHRLALHAARTSLAQGDLSDASARLAAVDLDETAPIWVRLLADETAAELAEARGQRSGALAHVRSGLQQLHAWQASFGSLDLQSTLVGHGHGLARLGLRIALDEGRPELVLEWSERARALASRVLPVRPPVDPELAADLSELRMLGDDQKARREQLRARIRQRHWYGEGGGDVTEPVGLSRLQERLGRHDAALLAHLVLDDRLHALVVTEHSAVVRELGSASEVRRLLDRAAADLDTAAANRSGPFAEAIRDALTADLADVADALVAPVLDLLGDRRVVLTPSGLLAGTPWSLLPGLGGRPLTVPQSATRWHLLTEHASVAPARIGLVAGPGVARAEEEVRRAAAAWRAAQLLTGDQATAQRVSDLAGSSDVLHLAGHGRHVGEHPLFSAVQLHDGPWYGYDVDTLTDVPPLVVLSACELGRASVRSAEETVGMTAAWLHAGARTVVSSPVVVADDTACAVLADWHGRVAAGAAPADALAAAVAAAEDLAPFVCFGAGW